MGTKISKYILENDSTVEVHKVFGDRFYFAIVELDGNYPKKSKVAHDIKRAEYLYVIEGTVNIDLNNKLYELKKGDNLLIQEDDKYAVEGKGKILVFVKDRKGGESRVE